MYTGMGPLTRMSPFRSRPGSMVMQMLVWLSPWTLLWEWWEKKERVAEEVVSSSPCSVSYSVSTPTSALSHPPEERFSQHPTLSLPLPHTSSPRVPTGYLLDARRVYRLHGLVDAQKGPAPWKRRRCWLKRQK